MDLVEQLKRRARARKMQIILGEGPDPRMVEAAATLVKEEICGVTILGPKDEILAEARKQNLNFSGVEIFDFMKSDKLDDFAGSLCEIRKAKGMTPDEAKRLMTDDDVGCLYFGAMMVKKGMADGMVTGACHSTGNVLRAAIHVVGTRSGCKVVSSSMIMVVPKSSCGEDKILIFSDPAFVPAPTAEQLADIAISSASTYKALIGVEPVVAMLSFSTKGSAKHPTVDKVIEATKIAQEKAPHLAIDGELQADAAIVEKVAAKKAPGSKVAGHANVLVFPDLNAANISYKLVQRLGGADAFGPIAQGLGAPVNDLSRGCSANDIVVLAAITSLQAQS
ncbi:MAG: phosphate acetyltransferase [Candidatus Coatesbacteria bacterium]|nr:MAG: phosphate acetyltransferase [Candidatus Coatesbacteria bacterium]